MKMIKLIGLVVSLLTLNGCAVHDMALASKNTQEITRSCVSWQQEARNFPFNSVEDCVIDYLEKKDAALQRLGRKPESKEDIARIKSEKEEQRKRMYEYHYGTETIADLERKADEEARKRRQFGMCVIGTEAAYQDDLNSAYEAGDYEKVQLLRSKKYKYKLRKQCEDLLNQ